MNGRSRRSSGGNALVASTTCARRARAPRPRSRSGGTPAPSRRSRATARVLGACRTPEPQRRPRRSPQASCAGSTQRGRGRGPTHRPGRSARPPRPRICVAVEERRLVPEPPGQFDASARPVDLVRLGGHRQLAGPLEVAVDAVLRAPSARWRPGSPARAVRAPPSRRGSAPAPLSSPWVRLAGAEAAVAPGRRPAGAVRASRSEHVAGRVGLLGQQRGPQPGVAGADDERGRRSASPGQRRRRRRGVRRGRARTSAARRRRARPARRSCRHYRSASARNPRAGIVHTAETLARTSMYCDKRIVHPPAPGADL